MKRDRSDPAAALVVSDDRAPLLPTDRMVRKCIKLCIERQWIVGHSHLVVAKEFGVMPSAAYQAYRDALRFIRIAQDAGANRTQILIRAREIAEGDEADRLPALTLIAKMTGALEPPKGELQTHDERVQYLRECLRDPDDELLTALLEEKEAVMRHFSLETEGESVETSE